MEEKELKLLNIDIISSIILIGSVLVSIYLTYNKKNSIENKKSLSDNTAQKINIINRIVSIGIVLIVIYSNQEAYKLAKLKNEELEATLLQVISSYILLIPAIIALYVSITSKNQIASFELPD